jgi:ATP-binding cassette subfamily B protein
LRILVTLFVESVICVILGYGGYLVYRGDFNAGQLVEFIGYFTAVVWPVMAVSELIDMTSRGKASLGRIGKLLDETPTVRDRADARPIGAMRGEVEFSHLTFRYPDGEFDALSDVSFRIEAGENVGLVGRTGSGKTTLVDLILRTYNVPDGTLFVDGHDVNSVTIRSLRAGCAYVPQDNFLFSDTVGANIGFSEDSPDPERIKEAAEFADVADNIEAFPDGYETLTGERGVTLSGGQKQRVSLARAYLKNAPILVLDDSVSAVDVGTEETILRNIRVRRAGKTAIIIGSRVSTVSHLNRIIVLNEGRLEAFDTPENLIKTSPTYAKMVFLQELEKEVKGGGE